MNNKDLMLVSFLRQDGRVRLTDISRKTGIPVSTLFDRMRGSDSVITRHTCLLDFGKLGYNTRSTIMLKVERDDKQALKDYLMKHPAVNAVFKINNGFDYMVEGIFRQVNDVEEFLDLLENKFGIQDKKTFFVVEDIKREGFMSDPQMLGA